MKTVARSALVFLVPIFVAGCAVVTTLDHPAAQVTLTDTSSTDRAKEVWFSPVDFFDEGNTDAGKVCKDTRWNSPVGANDTAIFSMRTSSRTMNFLNQESMFDNMEKMNRGFAICTKRAGGGVEYLTTIKGWDTMFAAGARLRVNCQFGSARWTCGSLVAN